jgi:hypothetical protein
MILLELGVLGVIVDVAEDVAVVVVRVGALAVVASVVVATEDGNEVEEEATRLDLAQRLASTLTTTPVATPAMYGASTRIHVTPSEDGG